MDRNREYAVVFSGGGALGAWEVGALQVLEEYHQRLAGIVTGASAGALNAAAVRAGLTSGELAAIWNRIRPEDVYTSKLTKTLVAKKIWQVVKRRFWNRLTWSEALTAGYGDIACLYDTRPLQWLLTDIFSDRWKTFEASPVPFAVTATDIRAKEKRIFYRAPAGFVPPSHEWKEITSVQELVAALLGSTALPVLFPATVDGLADGGVLRNQPIGPADKYKAKLIYVLIPSPVVPGRIGNIREIIESLLEIWLSVALENSIKVVKIQNEMRELAGQAPIILCVIRPPRELGVGLLSFGEKVPDLIAAGRQDAHARLGRFDLADPATWY